MENCKWDKDGFCVNADCEHCSDFCDHYKNSQECECYEAEETTFEEKTKPSTTDAVFVYWQ